MFGLRNKETFFENILNLDLWFRCGLNTFSTALVALLLCEGNICAILVEDIMGNILVKLFYIWTSGSDVV